MKNTIVLFSMQKPGIDAFNFTAKKVALACNSCAGWVGGAGNLIAVAAVTVRIQSTDFGISDFLLEEHLTLYYTVFILRRQAQGSSKSFW